MLVTVHQAFDRMYKAVAKCNVVVRVSTSVVKRKVVSLWRKKLNSDASHFVPAIHLRFYCDVSHLTFGQCLFSAQLSRTIDAYFVNFHK